MVVVKEPTKKQLELAKRLGIENPSSYTRRELGKLIEERLKGSSVQTAVVEPETPDVAPPEVAVPDEGVAEGVYEYYGRTNIQKPVIIEIPIAKNRETFRLMKKKKTYEKSTQNTQNLFEEFVAFLKWVGAKVEGERIIIVSGSDESIKSPAYLMSVLEGFFVDYIWKYQ